tara:strand:- start:9147 stop:12833 length:3687 start_codon:yes stop_codon:yes gene_type:complete
MAKSFRVRTDIRRGGTKDKNITFELKQDFDLLEILSLSLTQQEVYTRMCADFGVVVGRVITNGGFGVPNAKVSIFIPLDREDEGNEVIKFLYPYKQAFDVDDEGKRYNLLSSEKTFDCHVSVGTFPTLGDVLNKQDVKYVYDKYYKFTVKTNDAGDFMIYGVPVGNQNIVMDVDVSDIGCFSLLPEDFKVKGYADSDFDGPRFKDDVTIDSLPQIINLQKTIDVRPFWGDEEMCRASITRVDFDLSTTGFKLEPTSVFMGSTATDTDKDSVNLNCRPKRFMGELCSLITKPGIIDCIRYTPFFKNDPTAYPNYDPGGWNVQPPLGGEVPILERYYLENGGRVIDDTGAFLVHMPMNLDYMVTNEFGEMVLSDDPSKGVPTRTRVRFRVRPEQATGGARLRRIGSFLVPNIREYYDHTQGNADGDWPGIEPSSYAFSIEYSDYHPWAQRNMIPAAKDVFFDMTFNRVYTFSQFHDHIKHGGRRQFIGIKNILPEMDQQCSTTAMFFPINSAVRSPNMMVFLWMFLIDFLGLFYMLINTIVSLLAIFLGIILGIILVVLWIICIFWCAIYCFTFSLWGWTLIDMQAWLGSSAAPPEICGQLNLTGFGCGADCEFFGLRMGFILFKLRQTKYPECEKCMCRTNTPLYVYPPGHDDAGEDIPDSLAYLATKWPCPAGWPAGASAGSTNPYTGPCVPQCPPGNATTEDDFGGKWEHDCCGPTDAVRVCCPDNYGFDSGNPDDPYTNGTSNDGIAGGGCYVKIICFSPACIPQNFNMTVLVQWTRREKISVALCNGIMNYFWENSWVSGFLYQWQFKAKVEYDEITESYATNSRYCKKLTYLHPTEHTFYYRSTPFRVEGMATGSGSFIGDTDGVYKPWWMIGGGNATSDMHAKGDMDRHILFPTTMVDMGSRNQCIQQICLDPNFAEECSVTDQIGSTTFQDITNLVSDVYNIKMQFPYASMSTFFPRPEYEIGGDVAQALMQNCMLGVYGYETNMGGVGCDCDFPNMVSTQLEVTGAIGGLEYPSPNFTAGTYIPHAINVNNLNGNSEFEHNIMWEPLLFTGQTQTIMDGQNLIDCLTMSLSASSQYVPFYPWHQRAGAASSSQGFGDVWNDWLGTTGQYRYAMGIPGPLMSVLPALNLQTAEGTSIHPVGNNCTTGGTGTPCVWDGNFQHYMGNPPFTYGAGNYPLMDLNSNKEMVFSQPLFYFFGLRPGATSYNTFVRKYIDEELADTVI